MPPGRAGHADSDEVFRLVQEPADDIDLYVDVAVACRVLRVSRSGYYEWRGKPAVGTGPRRRAPGQHHHRHPPHVASRLWGAAGARRAAAGPGPASGSQACRQADAPDWRGGPVPSHQATRQTSRRSPRRPGQTDSSWLMSRTDVLTLVPRVLLFITLAGPTPSGDPDAPRRCQGCSHPSRHLPRPAALSFTVPAATGPAAKVSHLHSNHQRLVAPAGSDTARPRRPASPRSAGRWRWEGSVALGERVA